MIYYITYRLVSNLHFLMRLAILLGFILGLTHGTVVSESYSANNYENSQLFFTQKNSNIFSSL